jgi:hypothetical protein
MVQTVIGELMPTETRGFQSTRNTTINKSRCSCMVSLNLSLIRSTPGNVKILIALSFYAEIGHNLNLGHSGGLDGLVYTNHTGLMGNPWYDDDVGAMCFNAAKSWQLGWYDSSTIVINPRDNLSWTGIVVGIADFQNNPQNNPVIVKIETRTGTDQFIAFNRATGINRDNKQASDEVTVVEAGENGEWFSQSLLRATLKQEEQYVFTKWDGTNDLMVTAKVVNINTGADAGYAEVSVCLGPCPNPNTASPTAAPSKAPTPRPTASPKADPSKAPTPGPTASPTASPSKAPTPSPTVSPTKSPTSTPSIMTNEPLVRSGYRKYNQLGTDILVHSNKNVFGSAVTPTSTPTRPTTIDPSCTIVNIGCSKCGTHLECYPDMDPGDELYPIVENYLNSPYTPGDPKSFCQPSGRNGYKTMYGDQPCYNDGAVDVYEPDPFCPIIGETLCKGGKGTH